MARVVVSDSSTLALPTLTGPADVAESWPEWLREAFSSAPNRFRHSHAVWQRTVELRLFDLPWLDPARADVLELAALLHDVGRALDPANAEPHGFVGARLLDAMGLHEAATLVAHHSGARREAFARGMSHLDVWGDGDRDLQAVLTYVDRTTSPHGVRVTLSQRRAELAVRYGAPSRQVRLFDSTLPEVRHARRLLRPRMQQAD